MTMMLIGSLRKCIHCQDDVCLFGGVPFNSDATIHDCRTSRVAIACKGFRMYEIVADGPAEAKFLICGQTGLHPDQVTIEPQFRHPGFTYVGTVGPMPDLWVADEQVS